MLKTVRRDFINLNIDYTESGHQTTPAQNPDDSTKSPHQQHDCQLQRIHAAEHRSKMRTFTRFTRHLRRQDKK